MQFVKMHGIGNDYVYVNCLEQTIDDPAALAPVIADRHFGVGGDGLIVLLPAQSSVGAHVRMRMFNADGSEAEMCGNGIRCLCKLAHDDGVCTANPMRVQTGRGVLELTYTCDDARKIERVTVDMGEPILAPADIPVDLPGRTRVVNEPLPKLDDAGSGDWMAACGLDKRMTCVSMGNPHAVLYCRAVARVPLAAVGPVLENHSIFPRRINVHFVEVASAGEVIMRTWERGSGITLACGTGASAVCVAGVLTRRTQRQLLAHLPGGDLELHWRERDDHVLMTGPAVEVFRGDWPSP